MVHMVMKASDTVHAEGEEHGDVAHACVRTW